MNLKTLVLLISLPLIANGCSEHNNTGSQTSNISNEETPATTTETTDKWLGTWHGPEGTFLKVASSDDGYELTIQNLDGPRIFEGTAINNQIQFERDGHKELIFATDGEKTGMKWLSKKSNCLTIRYGEGYCRD